MISLFAVFMKCFSACFFSQELSNDIFVDSHLPGSPSLPRNLLKLFSCHSGLLGVDFNVDLTSSKIWRLSYACGWWW